MNRTDDKCVTLFFFVKKVLVVGYCWVIVGLLLVLIKFFEVVANVQLNLCHQCRHGDERAAQRFGFQDAFQHKLFVFLVNARVLCRVCRMLQRSYHVGGLGCTASDFRAQRVLPHRLVTTLLTRLKRLHDRSFMHCAQLDQIDGRHHFNGNLEALDRWISGNRFCILRVRGWLVRGSGHRFVVGSLASNAF